MGIAIEINYIKNMSQYIPCNFMCHKILDGEGELYLISNIKSFLVVNQNLFLHLIKLKIKYVEARKNYHRSER